MSPSLVLRIDAREAITIPWPSTWHPAKARVDADWRLTSSLRNALGDSRTQCPGHVLGGVISPLGKDTLSGRKIFPSSLKKGKQTRGERGKRYPVSRITFSPSSHWSPRPGPLVPSLSDQRLLPQCRQSPNMRASFESSLRKPT